jgi:hypothetical protein
VIGRCPHVCCFDRSNRWHTHPTGADECELCARVPAPKVGRLRSMLRWAKRLVGAAAVAAVLAWLAVSMLSAPGWAAGS